MEANGVACALRERIAYQVRVLRRGHGWSQEELADRCNLHRTYIGAVERAERNLTLETIAKLAFGLRVPLWRLLTPARPDNGDIREDAAIYEAAFAADWRRHAGPSLPNRLRGDDRRINCRKSPVNCYF